MAKLVEMPKLSPTMEEGVFAKWHKKEGDTIGVDDLLAEVETDKATMEFRSFDAGTILKLLVSEGATIKLGEPVAIIGNAGEDISALLSQAGASGGQPSRPAGGTEPAPAPDAQSEEGAPSEAGPESPAPNAQESRPATHPGAPEGDAPAARAPSPGALPTEQKAAATAPRGNTLPTARPPRAPISKLDRTEHAANVEPTVGRVLASPFIRKTARELGVDLNHVRGSGPMGRVTQDDLTRGPEASKAASSQNAQNAQSTQMVPAAQTAPLGLALAAPAITPLSPMRKTIAKRLVESKRNVPHFYLTVDLDVAALTSLRERVNAELLADLGERATKVSLNDFIVKACALGLVRVPTCNAQFSDEGLMFHKRVDISVAVAVEDGLVTPVVRNADQKSVSTIAREIRELAGRARQKKLKPEEMQNGTFSVSNLGMFGIDEFSAVINPPEGAILAIGQTRDVPVVKDGAVVPGKRLSMTLSCDHRVIDGAVGASFLAELRTLVEHPMRILTG